MKLTRIIFVLIKKCTARKTCEKHLSSKFGMKDHVYVIYDYKIHEGKIVGIDGSLQPDGLKPQQTIVYTINLLDVNVTIQLSEDFCFESKEALKNSL